jgi:hypothetical protein
MLSEIVGFNGRIIGVNLVSGSFQTEGLIKKVTHCTTAKQNPKISSIIIAISKISI